MLGGMFSYTFLHLNDSPKFERPEHNTFFNSIALTVLNFDIGVCLYNFGHAGIIAAFLY